MLLVVSFEDIHGNTFEWAPKWKEIQDIFEDAMGTEEFNAGKDWAGMAETALGVLVGLINNFHCRSMTFEMPPIGSIRKDKLLTLCRVSQLKTKKDG